MAARGKLPTETMPKPGKVSEVVQEWLVKEDGALAQRLQSEEISQHYEQNRYRNGVLRDDAPRARHQQLVEDHLAARRQALEQQRLLDQYAADAETARRLAAEDALAAARERRRQEEDDARIAAQLAEEDKQERRQMRERRQVVQEARLLGLETRLTQMALRGEETAGATSDDPSALSPHSMARCSTVLPPAAAAAASTALPHHPMPYSDDDLSDLMAPPPSGELLSEDDIRTWQERQDEEVARLLQEQDGKRRGDMMPRGQRVALEAQDRELAKVLQEQERARLRRAKDRARERRRLKQQEQLAAVTAAAAVGSEDEQAAGAEAETSVMRLASSNGVYSPVSPDAWSPVESAAGGPMMGEPPRETSSPLPPSSHPLSSHHRPLLNSVAPAGGVSNIAMMIDPTYQRRHRSQQLVPSTTVQTERNSSGATLATPISHHQLQQHSPQPSMQPPLPVRTDRMYEAAEAYSDEEDEAQFVPPYMPIQGQRRGNSLEKRRQRRSRDANCKQQ